MGGGFHPDEDLRGNGIQLGEFLGPHLPALLRIGEGHWLDHHAFVWPTHTSRTGLASHVNPTDILDGVSSSEETDVVWLMFHLLVLGEPSLCGLSTWISERETRPTMASVSSSWIGNLAWRLVSANRWLLQQAS
jgi:hypothetical protein